VNEISIVIPVYNESSNISDLIIEIDNSLKNYSYEIVIIDDGSNDDTLSKINILQQKYKIKLLKNQSNKGQSFSIYKGVENSTNETIITIDGDGQNNPKDIPKMIKYYKSKNNLSLLGGIRKKRIDSFIKILSSRIANKVRSFILKDNCKDTGCSLKIFKKNIFLKIDYFDGMHRFLPALFLGLGYKTDFIEVGHRPRLKGVSKYGVFDRLFKGIYDLIKVKMIISKKRK
tara:strand:- start:6570 stop:7259 length:690 start_codon:yes stop_codon:yes gene_type:complete